MGKWNYRLFLHRKNDCAWIELHEVFYDDNDKITTWTEDEVTPCGETKQEYIESLEMILKDCNKYKVLDENILEEESEKENPNYENAEIKE